MQCRKLLQQAQFDSEPIVRSRFRSGTKLKTPKILPVISDFWSVAMRKRLWR